ncbi:hypothetical protein C5167_046373 [Papaver somniferum]|uniref:Uncharacterized protein n=1 Tax=Papaver somniferum TaxID=3469 RepID=A0A4Y7LF67_PAPSO|nr:hypothetical protein C5167_046373 [Papaver somniferum]
MKTQEQDLLRSFTTWVFRKAETSTSVVTHKPKSADIFPLSSEQALHLNIQEQAEFNNHFIESSYDKLRILVQSREQEELKLGVLKHKSFVYDQLTEIESRDDVIIGILDSGKYGAELPAYWIDMVHGVDFRSAVRYGNYFMLHNFKETS